MSRRLAVKGKDGKGKRVSVSLQHLQDTAKKLISIIIPTKNEEKYLPQLLESIKKQTVQPYEIIVADAGSTDRTVEIAKKYGAKVVKGGLAAEGRNNGASIAKGDILVFIDADAILPTDTILEQTVKKIKETGKPIAYKVHTKFFSIDKTGNKLQDISQKLSEIFTKINVSIFALFKLTPPAGIIAVRKKQYLETGPFNIAPLGEDSEYIARLRKRYGVTAIPSPILISTRRFKSLPYVLLWILVSPLWLTLEILKTNSVVAKIYYSSLHILGNLIYNKPGSSY